MPYTSHPLLTTPSDETVIWRYLSFAKFMELIEYRKLWFARVDQFEDPLESTFTDAELRHLAELPSVLTPGGREQIGLSHARANELVRLANFVNCWRAGNSESMAMWDIYAKGEGTVAVTSTVGLLKQSFESYPRNIYLGRVNYLEWNALDWANNAIAISFRKDRSYEHEAEIRAAIWGLEQPHLSRSGGTFTFEDAKENTPAGFEVDFDPARFVTGVVVAPRAQPRIVPLVKNILERYEMPIPVKASDRLTSRPTFLKIVSMLPATPDQ